MMKYKNTIHKPPAKRHKEESQLSGSLAYTMIAPDPKERIRYKMDFLNPDFAP
jgi:hypothetical protein